ncbi:DUF5060 domain-containing protein [Pleomorphovibrio marinus]|uniref:DUF5060 domain-containing protein n=1 Tax=Pleomorphovibrio marinus TaxID=2164132 RepID=UPI000E0A2CAC|nr:DUF5060 domain-containing protein [Pleomorphovibrio marinus]
MDVIKFLLGQMIVIALLGTELFAQDYLVRDRDNAWQFGVYELSFHTSEVDRSPFYDLTLQVTFTLPSGKKVKVEGFNDGGILFKARAYCEEVGEWQWESTSNDPQMDGQKGVFTVLDSDFLGKMGIHPKDPYQFAYDNGDWFVHIGDTGYRYVVASEPYWKEYIDQASEMGITKIRTWFAMQRSAVGDLFEADGKTLALGYWREIERRILYALEHHPHIILQLIPYAEDANLINKYPLGDPAARIVGAYAQARWSSFPNVQWTISNDMVLTEKNEGLEGREVHMGTIDMLGNDFARREPWGTLITNHQSRFTGYMFVNEVWSDLVTLEDLDQVEGTLIKAFRDKVKQPIVNDEDRYELYRAAAHRRYFFRRLMWASLLSGGHATYGGLRTYEAFSGHDVGPTGELKNTFIPYEGKEKGVWGYYDANREGVLQQGGHDFIHIHGFFNEAGISLVGMQPDDALVGNSPKTHKCIRDSENIIIYLANPSGDKPETDFPKQDAPSVSLDIQEDNMRAKWFNPSAGTWVNTGIVKNGTQELKAPAGGDWVLWLSK